MRLIKHSAEGKAFRREVACERGQDIGVIYAIHWLLERDFLVARIENRLRERRKKTNVVD